jgi:hypothetical protein
MAPKETYEKRTKPLKIDSCRLFKGTKKALIF